MEYILFIGYLVFFAWLITRIKFFTNTGLSPLQLIILFFLKVIAGIFYGWIGLYYGGLAQMSDTWGLHALSIQEYNLLHSNPNEYLTNLFHDPYDGGFQKFFAGSDSYWNDLKGNVFIKVLSIFDIFSFGHYYVNVIFYSFITLSGPVAIYKVMSDVFPDRKTSILLATFLVPSFLYWTSGIHKEGLIFLGISLIISNIYFGWKAGRYSVSKIAGIITGFLLLLLLRNFLLVIILPAVLTWIIANKWPKKAFLIFISVYTLFIVAFFSIRYLNPVLDFPLAVVSKQQEFMNLAGGSTIPIKKLEPDFISFLKKAPEAFTISTIRPYPKDVKHILSLAAATEVQLLLLMLLAMLLLKTTGPAHRNFIYFCVFFSFSLLLAIGFSVNNLGAIVRYRSVIIPLLVVPMAAQIDWKRVGKYLLNGIKNKNNTN